MSLRQHSSQFYEGTPYYRQGSVQALLGVPLTASTVFDQTELGRQLPPPRLPKTAPGGANAVHFHIDDTADRILDQQPIVKKQRNSERTRSRSGVYSSSGLIATTEEGHRIILFETNIGHAGKFSDDVLSLRDSHSPPPILMSDALPSNTPSKPYPIIPSLCNSHARRQFVDVISHFPEEVE